ncbi:DUF4832 domain-containing protein [Oscillatoria nigro-viridis]|nr:DUF4832 domain-containing protein [Oscillatoria nigro-viridis]
MKASWRNAFEMGKIAQKLAVIGLVLMSATSCQPCAANSTSYKTTLYENSYENFPNPERGFFVPFNPLGKYESSPLKVADLEKVRSENMSLVRRIYTIADFRDRPLSKSFLQKVSNDCEIVRKAGLKIIIRFAYNWLGGGPDAPQERILSHIEQLKPIFAANSDTIAYLEAGFIGYWGEWNRSTNGLDKNSEARRTILFKILSAVPTERMVAIRYPYYKRDAFNNKNPLTSQEAFNGSYRSRTGAHNNCFLAAIDDWGTYNHTDPKIVDAQKTYLNLDNRYVVQGGETCNPSEYDDCPNALADLERMRWSALNTNLYDGLPVLRGWEEQGCMKEIQRRLGYRFRLLNSVIPVKVKAGRTFSMDLKITNDGWASPYNKRLVEVMLRDRQTQAQYYLAVTEDPRMWMPGTDKSINIKGAIPVTMPSGEYEVLLNLPDPAPRLYNRPEYSIRFANQKVWEESTGYNSLLQSVIIEPRVAGDESSGEQLFKQRQKVSH